MSSGSMGVGGMGVGGMKREPKVPTKVGGVSLDLDVSFFGSCMFMLWFLPRRGGGGS